MADALALYYALKNENDLIYMRSYVNGTEISERERSQSIGKYKQTVKRYIKSTKDKPVPNNGQILLLENQEHNDINENIVLGFEMALKMFENKPDTKIDYDKAHIKNMSRNDLMVWLQSYFDKQFKKYHLFVFSYKNGRIAEFKGTRNKTHRQSLGIYINGQTVYAVKDVKKLFGANSNTYCPMNSTIFTFGFGHDHKCPLLCNGCYTHGYTFPCKDNGLKIRCNKCHREFKNRDCYERHFEKICTSVKLCRDCSTEYLVKPNKKHVCYHKLCSKCSEVHGKNEDCPLIFLNSLNI